MGEKVMWSLRLVVFVFLLFVAAPAQAGPTLAPQMSPIVTWDPDRDISRPPTKRPLTAAELKLGRERADRFYNVVKAAPSFSRPTRYVTLVTSWPVVADSGVVRQSFTVYWSNPADVVKRADGSLWPKVGGAHLIMFVETNWPPGANHLEDPATRGNFSRGVENTGLPEGVFALPRTLGEVSGGTFYAMNLVITRDGRPILEPTPLGPLLEGEVARYRKMIAELDQGTKRSLEQLEASMNPQARAERRAKRAERWKTQYRNPDSLTRELDAADRSDESDYQRQKERLTPPPTRDPKSVYWGPRLALEAVEKRLAGLDAAGRAGAACARVDPAFTSGQDVRFEPLGSGVAGCVPMVRIRKDLVDPKRPNEIQLVNLWFAGELCGEHWAGKPSLRSDRCDAAVSLLRELDWSAMRKVMGW